MKCTCPMQTHLSHTQHGPYSTGLRWGSSWALIGRVGHYSLTLGTIGSSWAVALGLQGLLDTYM